MFLGLLCGCFLHFVLHDIFAGRHVCVICSGYPYVYCTLCSVTVVCTIVFALCSCPMCDLCPVRCLSVSPRPTTPYLDAALTALTVAPSVDSRIDLGSVQVPCFSWTTLYDSDKCYCLESGHCLCSSMYFC